MLRCRTSTYSSEEGLEESRDDAMYCDEESLMRHKEDGHLRRRVREESWSSAVGG